MLRRRTTKFHSKIRAFLFSATFYLWITFSMIAALPLVFSYRTIYFLAHYWSLSVAWLMKVILGANYKIEGLENLPLNSGFVVASKHQSAWETIIMFALLPKACFIYKKELSYIPIYGWYNIVFKNIKVDRKGGMGALKKVISQAKQRVEQGHQVIIFPQGTRTQFGQTAEYKPAVYAMYREGLPVYPAALNSGLVWPKRGMKRAGTITLKFLPRIGPGLGKDEFMSKLESVIEAESMMLASG